MLIGLIFILSFLNLNSGVFSLNKANLKDFTTVQAIANEGGVVWSRIYGQSLHDRAKALIQTTDNGFVLAGSTQDPIWRDTDIWLTKTDPNGIELWTKRYDWGWNDDLGALIQTTHGGFALAGRTQPSGGEEFMWFVKTDTNGTAQWEDVQTYEGSESTTASALVQTVDDGFFLAGSTSSFGTGESDMWLAKTDTNGTIQWNQTYGGTENEEACGFIQTSDGGLILGGFTESLGAGERDMWLIKTDANGTAHWNQTYGGPEYDAASALVETADGGFALAGNTDSFGAGERDMWLVKIDANGTTQWSQPYGGIENEEVFTLIETADSGFALAGYTRSVGAGSADMCLVKTDPKGTIQWIQTQGGPAYESASALLQTTDGDFVMAGTKIYSILGRQNPTSSDMLLVKTSAFGNTQWSPITTTESTSELTTTESTNEITTMKSSSQVIGLEFTPIPLALLLLVISIKRKQILNRKLD